MPAKRSATTDLAYRWVTEVRRDVWNYRSKECMRFLGEAKNMVHPKPKKDPVTGITFDPEPADVDTVIRAGELYRDTVGEAPGSMFTVNSYSKMYKRTWYEQASKVEDAPPLYEKEALRQWLIKNAAHIPLDQFEAIDQMLKN